MPAAYPLTPSLEGRGTIAIERNVALSPKRTSEQNGVLAILRFSLGAGVTPAEGSVKPTAGFTYNRESIRCIPGDATIRGRRRAGWGRFLR